MFAFFHVKIQDIRSMKERHNRSNKTFCAKLPSHEQLSDNTEQCQIKDESYVCIKSCSLKKLRMLRIILKIRNLKRLIYL